MRETRERGIALLEAAAEEHGDDDSDNDDADDNGASRRSSQLLKRKSQAKATVSAIDEELEQAEGMRRQLREDASAVALRIGRKREESMALLTAALRRTEDEMARMVRQGEKGWLLFAALP